MKYIGNFADWIKPEWVEEVMSKPGFDMPKHSIRNEARFNPILKSYFEDVDRITTQKEFDQILKDLSQLDPNNKIVIHAKTYVDYLNPNKELDDEFIMYENAGYDIWGTHFKLLEKFDVSFDILENPPPFLDYKNKHITWWFSKMHPGNLMPMHVDRASYDVEVHKYWMPWTKYQPGHIFMCEDQVITEYKLGDVWMFENPFSWHGAINIGHTPRAVLQITDSRPSRDINAI